MRKLLLVATLAVSLAGCQLLTEASVNPTAVIVAANGFDAVEATATNYLSLRRCAPTTGPVCRSPTVSKLIIANIRSGRLVRDKLVGFLRTHPGALGVKGDYDALIVTTETLQAIINQYNIGAR